MNNQRQPKFQRAYDFLLTSISRGEFAATRFFPSVSALAQMAGVSTFTMWRVVDRLRREGRLVGSPGHRLSLPGRRDDDPPQPAPRMRQPSPRRTKYSALQLQIRRDLLNGRFRHDSELPSEKELIAHYGVSRMTLRKALASLADQSILARRGKRFSPMSIAPHANHRRPRIILLGQGSNMGHSITWGYWHQEYVKLLELECAKARISLDVGCFVREDDELRVINGRDWKRPFDITDRTDVEGYIYEVTGHESIDDELLGVIARSRRPVAILDELGTWPAPAFLNSHPNVRVFRNTVSAQPALQVARFVLELGHRTAVYLSPYHNLEYSLRRLDGLQQAFAAVEDARIVPVTSHLDFGAAATQAATRARVDELDAFHDKWVSGIPAEYAASMQEAYVQLRTSALEGRLQEDLHQLCHRAVEIPDATAWIIVNDACACTAVDFLENVKRVALPGDMSVISFDDLPVVVTKGISSYNFNGTATMIAMLRFVTNPRLFPVSRPVIEIEGYVIPRRTTGRVRSG